MCQDNEQQLAELKAIMEETHCAENNECFDKYFDRVSEKKTEEVVIISCDDFNAIDKDKALNGDIVYLCPILSYVIDALSYPSFRQKNC